MATAVEDTLTVRGEFELQHDRLVRDEIETFRRKAHAFLAGEIPEDDFRPFRLKHGIYGQRQPGVQMVRCKVPGGLMTAAQMNQLAAVSDAYAGGKGHITTRQNMQFHFVPLEHAADVMHMLADAGLTNREACYNTVRNVTTCALAGLSHDEVFDVRPYAQRIAYAFLRKDLTSNLPRKFKIAFDGCRHQDCIAGAINDIGLRAVIRDGRRGFHMVIGGGLGPLPTEARLLDEFLPEDRLLNRCEAVVRLFNKYGNRMNRNKARLKFVLRERGIDWLREQIEREYAGILENGGIPWPELVPEGFGGYQSQPPPLGQGALLPVIQTNGTGDPQYDRWLETNIVRQKHPGYATVVVRVDQGNLTSRQMRGLARLATDAADGLLRIGIDQNILLGFVPLARLRRLHAALTELGLGDAGAREIADVTTCPGAYSCNLALTKSMNLGAALQQVVAAYDDPLVRKLSIKVSGCPNSCGQHWIADFGFYGNARKIDGREIPYYQMLLGGGFDGGGIMRFGLAVQSVPARLAPEAVTRVLDHYLAHRAPAETFRDYVMRHKVETFRGLTDDLARPADLYPEIYQDWGDDSAFSLQLGRGECAA
ncbi:MAG TPA: nitrite/sulfite reductase [Bryobacteraceae bacterium]|nr:nitrite/sulfite reductase [Bryobacteraceae bacterium]